MQYVPDPSDATLDHQYPDLPRRLLQVQAQLRTRWAARQRYRTRCLRLEHANQAHKHELLAPGALPPLAAELLARAQAQKP